MMVRLKRSISAACLREVQFLRRARKAQVPRDRFEHFQLPERRVFHRTVGAGSCIRGSVCQT